MGEGLPSRHNHRGVDRLALGGTCSAIGYKPVSKLNRVTVATDGSGETRGGPGGWGWAAEDGPYQWGGDPHTTHQVMELTAVLELLRVFPPDQPLSIQADSIYVIKTFTEWLPVWRKNGMRGSGGKEVAHRELIETIDGLLNGRDICWEKVKSHSGHPLNDMADSLARLGRIAAKRLDQTYSSNPASLTEDPRRN
ncbi:MAG: ribonuclease HI [Acidimicrobiia bacterium]|nr:ribonuclease HI [Acidimicrobiia bacterium]MXY74728.1 ribonuclease HI [Acidimicrobiia bacterium]MYB78906.1 ribonuclease HI [Acidimicrobiia bacterium]MYD41864.1 ribonuclease HI [Acidimicrobiia bacterium]MYG91312.1 ribonuclease HI [Acidimicrobiia bacterium]